MSQSFLSILSKIEAYIILTNHKMFRKISILSI